VFAGCGNEFLEVGDGVLFFEGVGEEGIEFAGWVEEVIVWVYNDDCGVGRHDG